MKMRIVARWVIVVLYLVTCLASAVGLAFGIHALLGEEVARIASGPVLALTAGLGVISLPFVYKYLERKGI